MTRTCTTSRPRIVRGVAAAAACALALTVGGCGGTDSSPTNPLASTAPAVPPGLESFYSQTVTWAPCADAGVETAEGAQCARISVPIDYDHADGDVATVMMAKVAARGTRIGTLFVNPGGPGASGVSFLKTIVAALPPDLTDAFDIVGFDPRGVGASTPIKCLDDDALGQFVDGSLKVPDDPELTAKVDAIMSQTGLEDQPIDGIDASDLRRSTAQVAYLAQQCRARSGPLVDHVDTVSAARDLDVMRALVGDAQLTYLGYSYGSFLGATYVAQFPGNVGRMVFDGTLSSGDGVAQVAARQARGLEDALGHFVDFCLSAGTCPLEGDRDQALSQIRDFLKRLADAPMRTVSGRMLTQAEALTGIVGPLYSESSYPALREALRQVFTHDDGSQLLALADQYNDRNPDGTFRSNSAEAFAAVNALDYPVTGDGGQWRDDATRLLQDAPTLGFAMSYPELGQLAWDAPSPSPRTMVTGEGAHPVLIINPTHDPATPLAMAQDVHQAMAGSRLMTVDTWDHTSLPSGSRCVESRLVDYLVDGRLPDEDVTCS